MRWVRAINLQQWAETLPAQTRLPGLIADLIRATARDISDIRFPRDDKGQVRGFDGILEATGVPPYVPNGDSVWEFGVSSGIGKKADSDYAKRTSEMDAKKRKQTTFVFVTPHTWDNPRQDLSEWLAEKRNRDEWKNVELLDGAKLEDWLALCPAVAARFAKYDLRLLPAAGVRSTDEFWEEFVTRFEPRLIEEVLVAGREAQAAELIRGLRATTNRAAFAADTPDEVIAFAIAAIRRADPEVRKFLEARAIVVDTADAARAVCAFIGHIFMPRGDARALAGLLSQSGPTIVSAGGDEKRGNHVLLARPHSTTLGQAFAAMGFSAQQGYDIARRCGRSLAVLARQRPSGTAETPKWVEDAEPLIPALLAGAWQASKDLDKEVLCALAERAAYEEVEAPLRRLKKWTDAPVDQVDDIWSMRASVDAFVNLGHLIGPEHLARFSSALKSVFSTVLTAPTADDVYRPFAQRNDGHSQWLREGLMNTLLHMAVLHDQAEFCVQGSSPREFVNKTVEDLLGLSSDHRLMTGLADNLALLAEAAPIPFLEALERLLEGDAALARPVFDERENFFAPTSPHVGLLWALETLAWDPELLLRVSMCLARLAEIDPQGRLQNRPINSLRSILLTWAPNTNADAEHRKAVLQHIVVHARSISWSLLEKLLPQALDSSDATAEPRFRDFGRGLNAELTFGEVWDFQSFVIRLAAACAGTDASRWRVLIHSMGNFPAQIFSEFFDVLRARLAEMADPARIETWDALRKEINRHRTFAGTDWALPESRLVELDAICEQFKPSDPFIEIAWLFDDWMPDVPGKVNNIGDPMAPVEAARKDALLAFYESAGVGGLAEVAHRAKIKHAFSAGVRSLELPQATLIELLRALLAAGSELDGVAGTVLAEALERFGDEVLQDFQEAIASFRIDAKRVAALFMLLPEGKRTWTIVESFGPDTNRTYWAERHPFFIKGDVEQLLFALEKYVAHSRPMAAIQASSNRLAEVPTLMIVKLLDAAIAEINAAANSVGTMTAHYIERVFDELEKRSDLALEQLARLEFAYLPIIDRRTKPLALHRILVENPKLFVDVIRAVFKRASGDAVDPSESEQRLATSGYRLLESLRIVPGQQVQDVDSDALMAWCTEVRLLAAAIDRTDVTDSRIGHLLARAPASKKDGAWPHESVRRVIEAISSDRLESGIAVERFNMRGVYSKAIGDGGQQERDLAQAARMWAQAMPTSPRTAALLRRIAASWEQHARDADVQAAKDALRD